MVMDVLHTYICMYPSKVIGNTFLAALCPGGHGQGAW